MKDLKNYAIILASGSGSRYGSDIPKQFIKIAGKTILEHTVEIFEKSNVIDDIIIVITPEYRHVAENILLKNSYKKVSHLLNGGETRKDSSFIGINSIEEAEANVLIHDCARPFLTQTIIDNCVEALEKYSAIDVAIPATDTVIEVDNKIISKIPNRSKLMRGQTPQCFKLSLIKKAHELAKNDQNFTDDCGLVIKYNLADVFVVNGDTENIKVTYPSDIFMADRLFQIRSNIFPNDENLKDIKDNVIVIFGGTSGIGSCIKELAEQNGAIVYACSSSTGCDITSYQAVEEYLKNVYEKTNRIDYVVNSAGILRMGKLTERNIEDIEKDVCVNYLGAINVAKASIPYLKNSQGGLLLFTSSSYTRGRALYSTYSSTKAGIVNLTQALAEELISEKVRINVINPERTATPMRFKAFGQEPEGSLLAPEKVAEASLKTLLSKLTGQVIDVRK
ncbi:MAG: 2-C-methyl-D-erythritol 4-phosphate cytidylyltransferase [Cyanobacteria bacterium SIG32]|nr:2-C-methyl-D-erythritol 4-phosphate cytidylyltransferase [Cyanobacteria bacterium SIG32]